MFQLTHLIQFPRKNLLCLLNRFPAIIQSDRKGSLFSIIPQLCGKSQFPAKWFAPHRRLSVGSNEIKREKREDWFLLCPDKIILPQRRKKM